MTFVVIALFGLLFVAIFGAKAARGVIAIAGVLVLIVFGIALLSVLGAQHQAPPAGGVTLQFRGPSPASAVDVYDAAKATCHQDMRHRFDRIPNELIDEDCPYDPPGSTAAPPRIVRQSVNCTDMVKSTSDIEMPMREKILKVYGCDANRDPAAQASPAPSGPPADTFKCRELFPSMCNKIDDFLSVLKLMLFCLGFLAAFIGVPALVLALSCSDHRPRPTRPGPRSMRDLMRHIWSRDHFIMASGRMTIEAMQELTEYAREHPRWRYLSSGETIAIYKDIMKRYGPGYEAYLISKMMSAGPSTADEGTCGILPAAS